MQRPLATIALVLSLASLGQAQDSCGLPAGRNCLTVRPTPGCSDTSCCSSVCAADAFCCAVEWDYICRQSAVELCSPPVPANDTIATAQVIQSGLFEVCTIGATTGETQMPRGCAGIFGDQILNDVWYRLVATHTGRAMVSSCPSTNPGNASEFDPIIIVRTAAGEILGCSDETVGCGGFAEVEWPITAGVSYCVQVGGHDVYVGFGQYTLTQVGVLPPSCPTDLNGNGTVNAQDLTIMMNGWGTASGDVTGDGQTNAQDLGALLNSWGSCP